MLTIGFLWKVALLKRVISVSTCPWRWLYACSCVCFVEGFTAVFLKFLQAQQHLPDIEVVADYLKYLPAIRQPPTDTTGFTLDLNIYPWNLWIFEDVVINNDIAKKPLSNAYFWRLEEVSCFGQ